MPYVLLFILAVTVAYLLLQQWRTRAYLRELEEAVRKRKPYLFSYGNGGWIGKRGIIRFSHALNELIAERDRSHKAGETYLQQIQITLDTLTDSVLIVDSRHRLVLANPAARKLLSLPENFEGKHLGQFLPSSKLLEYVAQNQAGRQALWREIEIHRNLGSPLFVEASTAYLTHSETPLMFIVLHDITRLKQLENVRREFVANVSHELRTPVTIIKGYSDALVSDHNTLSASEQLRFLSKIQKNVQRLHLLLEDLLTLSRLEGGYAGVNLKPTSLHKLIAEQIENFTPHLQANQRVSCEFDPRIDLINIDPIKMAQVIRNILDNALRYARGFTQIRLITTLENDAVVLAIEDNGCGIPQKDLPHIFERFYTVDKSRARDLGGTGLGLSIVKHILQLHNGQVKGSNIQPNGLRIECRLPLL